MDSNRNFPDPVNLFSPDFTLT